MLATTTSNARNASASGSTNVASTALARALSQLARIAWGSTSVPTASRAPSFNAAIASTPDPQP